MLLPRKLLQRLLLLWLLPFLLLLLLLGLLLLPLLLILLVLLLLCGDSLLLQHKPFQGCCDKRELLPGYALLLLHVLLPCFQLLRRGHECHRRRRPCRKLFRPGGCDRSRLLRL